MATPSNCVQGAYEETGRYEGAVTTTPYRISTATRFYRAMEVALDPGIEFLSLKDELGLGEAIPAGLVDSGAPKASIKTRLRVADMFWLLGLAGFNLAFTPGDGVILDPSGAVVPAGATRIVATKRGGQEAQTAQLIAAYVSAGIFLKGTGFGVNQMSWGIEEGELSAELLGLVVSKLGSDPNLTPVLSDERPLRRRHAECTWSTGAAEATNLTFQLSNPLEQYYGLHRSIYPRSLDNGNERVELTGTIRMRTYDGDDFDKVIDGEQFTAEVNWKSDQAVGATAAEHSIWAEFDAQLTGHSADPLNPGRRHGAEYQWSAVDDGSGTDITFTGVTDLTAVETYI